MEIYTTRQVADRLGATPQTVAAWVRQGKFPNAYRLAPNGRTSPYRIPEEDVTAFEEKRHQLLEERNQKNPPTSDKAGGS